MSSTFEKLRTRIFEAFGLDFEFVVDLRRAPFDRVCEGLFVAGKPGVENVEALREAGITHVVSCLEAHERDEVAFLAEHFEWLFVPVRDGIDVSLAEHFGRVFEFTGAPNAAVLVHCQVGVSRSASVATAIVMRARGLRFIDALRVVREARTGVLPNIAFASQLQRLEHELLGVAGEGEPSSLAVYLHEICNVPAELELVERILREHDYDAPRALRALFGGEIPRVVQGVRR